MMISKSIKNIAGVICFVALPATSFAGIIGDSYQLDVSCTSGCVNSGPVSHLATLPGAGFDTSSESTYDVIQDEFFLQWISDDTFSFIVDFNSTATDNIVLALTGLNFTMGVPQQIIGVMFDEANSNAPEFANFGDFPPPATDFTANTVTISYDQSPELRGDGPNWAYKIDTGPDPDVGIPEPSTFVLIGLGLVGIGLRRLSKLV